MTMFKKSLIALSGALVVAMTLVSTADAQIAQGKNNVRPFTAAEKLWFQTEKSHPDRCAQHQRYREHAR